MLHAHRRDWTSRHFCTDHQIFCPMRVRYEMASVTPRIRLATFEISSAWNKVSRLKSVPSECCRSAAHELQCVHFEFDFVPEHELPSWRVGITAGVDDHPNHHLPVSTNRLVFWAEILCYSALPTPMLAPHSHESTKCDSV